MPKTAFPTCKCLRQLDNETDRLPVWPLWERKKSEFLAQSKHETLEVVADQLLRATDKGASNYAVQWRVQIGLCGRTLVEELTYCKPGNFRISRIYAQLGVSEE